MATSCSVYNTWWSSLKATWQTMTRKIWTIGENQTSSIPIILWLHSSDLKKVPKMVKFCIISNVDTKPMPTFFELMIELWTIGNQLWQLTMGNQFWAHVIWSPKLNICITTYGWKKNVNSLQIMIYRHNSPETSFITPSRKSELHWQLTLMHSVLLPKIIFLE